MKHRKQHIEDSEPVHLDLKTINKCIEIQKCNTEHNKDEMAIQLITKGIHFDEAFLFLNSDYSEPVKPSMTQKDLKELFRLSTLFVGVFGQQGELEITDYPDIVKSKID